MGKKKSKSTKNGKTYKIEFTFLSTFIWGIFLFFLLSWVFVLGILVGRGFLPEAVNTISDMRNQITKFQAMVNNKGSHKLSSPKKPEPDPKLAFYDRLSSKKDEVKRDWDQKKINKNINKNLTKNKNRNVQKVFNKGERKESTEQIRQPGSLNDKNQFTVQIASLENGVQAENLIKKLNQLGYSAYFYEVNIKGKVYYRVRCGRFSKREEAKKYAQKLEREEGIKGFVSRLE